MEKLIELIIEFQKGIGQVTYDLDMYHYDDKLKLIIIGSDVSKGFIDYIDIFRLIFAPGFIKWLVENDKIDRDNEDFESLEEQYFGEQGMIRYTSVRYRHLIMILAYRDNPIEFLISILK